MARVTRSQRRVFNNTIVAPVQQPGVVNLAEIDAAASGFRAVGSVAQSLGNALAVQQQKELAVRSAEYNSRVNLDFHDQFNEALKDPELQNNPQLARQRVDDISNGILSSDEFMNQPRQVQRVARRQLAGLKQSFGLKAIDFERKKSFENTISAINQTQNNFEVQALTTDTSMDDMLTRFTATVAAATKAGVLNLNQAEEQVRAGSRDIVLSRAQKFINEGNLDGASAIVDNPDMQDLLGAQGIQRVQDQIQRKRNLVANNTEKVMKLRASNPWKFVSKVDQEQAPPIDFTNVNGLSEQLDNRLEFIERKNQQYNLNLPVLNEAEQESVINAFTSIPPRQAASLANQVMTTLPDEHQDRIASQIFQENPSLGVALATADDDPMLAENLMNGQRVKKDKLIRLPSDTEVVDFVNDEVGESIEQPQFRKAIQEAVKSYYADKVFRENDNSGAIQADIVEEALDRLVGPRISINGKDIVGFRKEDGQFISDDDFEDFFDDLTPGALQSSLGDVPRDAQGRELPLEDIKDHANLITMGNGQYIIQMFDEFAVNQQGDPYILDMRRLFKDQPRLNIQARDEALTDESDARAPESAQLSLERLSRFTGGDDTALPFIEGEGTQEPLIEGRQ